MKGLTLENLLAKSNNYALNYTHITIYGYLKTLKINEH